MSKENLNDILEQKFMTAAKFSMEIENLKKISNGTMNYIECIIHFCAENNIEVETVSKLISKLLFLFCSSIKFLINFEKK